MAMRHLMTNSYCVADTETSLYNQSAPPEDAQHPELYLLEIPKHGHSTWCHSKNRIIYNGWLTSAGEEHSLRYDRGSIEHDVEEMLDWCLTNKATLIGHNIGYDILYWLKTSEEFRRHFHLLDIWDTQTAEYTLTAQLASMCSLDDITKKYGGEIKDNRMKECWNKGISTEDIPIDWVEPYLIGDLTNTELCYLQQRAIIERQGQLPLYLMRCRAHKANIEATFNGIRHDVNINLHYRKPLKERMEVLKEQAVDIMKPSFPEEMEINPGSDQQVRNFLFGGKSKYKKRILKWLEDGSPDTFKSGKKEGQQKSKLTDVTADIIGIMPENFKIPQHWRTEKGAASVNKDVMKGLQFREESPATVIKFAKIMEEYNKISQDLSSFFESYMLNTDTQGYLHPTFNEALTATGRLSSSKPNGQNISKSDIKKCLVSRFGDDGVICQIDFSQLECVGDGVLTKDAMLGADILEGRDFHCTTLAYILPDLTYDQIYQYAKVQEIPEWVSKRTAAKSARFLMNYGGGADAMSLDSGLTVETCKEIIKAEKERYQDVAKFKDSILKAASAALYPIPGEMLVDTVTGLQFPREVGYWTSPTGRIYHYKTKLSPQFMRERGQWTSISPTITKNYCTQGLCGGDTVPIALLKAWEGIKENSDWQKPRGGFEASVFYICTVHDAGYYDVHKDCIEEFAQWIKEVYTSTPKHMKELLGFDWFLPLEAEVSINPSFKEE